MQTRIKKWGNSLGLRLSGPLKSIPHFTEDMLVDVEITEKGLVVKPAEKKPAAFSFSESELLADLNEDTVHLECLASLLPKGWGEK